MGGGSAGGLAIPLRFTSCVNAALSPRFSSCIGEESWISVTGSAQAVQIPQFILELLQGVPLLGAVLFIMAMQSFCIVMPSINALPDIAGAAQLGAVAPRNTPSARTNVTIRRAKTLPNMERTIRPGTLSIKDRPNI